MHLQINLNDSLIDDWEPTLSESPPETHPLLRWRIEPLNLFDAAELYLCVNEETLYSFVLADLPGQDAASVQQQFIDQLRWLLHEHHFPGAAPALFMSLPVLFGRTHAPEIIEAIPEIKAQYELFLKLGHPLSEAERDVNTTPFELLNLHLPLEQFLGLRHTFPVADGRMVKIRFPIRFLYAARLRLAPNPDALYCFRRADKMDDSIEGTLPVDDLILLNAQIQTLRKKPDNPEELQLFKEMEAWLQSEIDRHLP